jgi:D-3-phosphoglycerate dehydrogenase
MNTLKNTNKKMNKKVFISTSSFGDFSSQPVDLLKEQGYDVILNPLRRKLNDAEVMELLQDAIGVIAGTEQYTKDVLERLPSLRVISRVGVGVDNIDFDATRCRSIKVIATKTDLSDAVAELSLGLMFDLSRKLSFHNADMENGQWSKHIGRLLRGKTLGIMGLGKIGKALVRMTSGLGLQYLAFDEYRDEEFAQIYNIQHVAANDLLKQADIVSIHLKFSAGLADFLSDEKLQLLKKDAIIINTSRGELINETALHRWLTANKTAGAGLDVFQQEPYQGDLVGLPNIVTTPHIGSYVKEIRSDMELEAVRNFIQLMNS